MDSSAVERAAQLLFAARKNGTILDGLPPDCLPETLAEAYATQDRLFALLDEPAAGWFVGCSNPAIQEQLGLPGPYRARLLRSTLHDSPADLRDVDLPTITLELEFAFRLGRDLPPRAKAYREAEVAAAVASVQPAIEVVTSHFKDWTHQPVMSVIADNGTDGALVLGPGRRDWRDLDLSAVTVELEVNGEIVRQGSGANVLGNPLRVMTWLANDLRAAGEAMAAGQVNNTGSCTAMYHAKPGDRAVARFAALGEVVVQF